MDIKENGTVDPIFKALSLNPKTQDPDPQPSNPKPQAEKALNPKTGTVLERWSHHGRSCRLETTGGHSSYIKGLYRVYIRLYVF